MLFFLEVHIVKSSVAWMSALVTSACLLTATTVSAQAYEQPWNVEASIGFDFGLSGDFLTSGIGVVQGVPVVFRSQPFDEVYGTGVQWQFGGGYMVDDINEVRAQFSYQRVGASLVELGTAGASDLVATFDDYRAWSIEGGYRHYFAPSEERARPYVGGLLGVSIIDEIDGVLAAPQAGIARYATDFYDGTAALTLGASGGLLYALNRSFDLNAQLGLRYNSGLSAIDGLQGTGLEDVNDKSSRWTMPVSVGLRVKF